MSDDATTWRVGLPRRLGTIARWPIGIGLTSWRYLWRTTPLHRVDEADDADGTPPSIPQQFLDEHIQKVGDGVGAVFHRRYSVVVEQPQRRAEEVMALLAAEPNRPAPVEVAAFRKTRGSPGPLVAGDEFVVRMPGPWDGPVRVVDATVTSFRLATLRGHLEAGQIEFRATDDGDLLRFSIESWSRSGDRLCDLLYDRVRLVKEMQLHMWVHYCERIAALAGGRRRGGITVVTHRRE